MYSGRTNNHKLISQPITGFVRTLKTLENLEFLESDFKALKVLESGFWSLKVLDFLLNKSEKYGRF